MSVSRIKPALLGFALCFGCAFQASAVDISRFDYQSATGMCSGTTSVGGSNLRYRPLSIDNIGSTDQFVSCGFQGDDQADGRGSQTVAVRVYNGSALSATIDCVLIDGFRSGANTVATFTNKSVDLAAGASTFVTWVPADITPAPPAIDLPQVQCVLPGGTSLQYGYKRYLEGVGL
jgi:hypothetical protein